MVTRRKGELMAKLMKCDHTARAQQVPEAVLKVVWRCQATSCPAGLPFGGRGKPGPAEGTEEWAAQRDAGQS